MCAQKAVQNIRTKRTVMANDGNNQQQTTYLFWATHYFISTEQYFHWGTLIQLYVLFSCPLRLMLKLLSLCHGSLASPKWYCRNIVYVRILYDTILVNAGKKEKKGKHTAQTVAFSVLLLLFAVHISFIWIWIERFLGNASDWMNYCVIIRLIDVSELACFISTWIVCYELLMIIVTFCHFGFILFVLGQGRDSFFWNWLWNWN